MYFAIFSHIFFESVKIFQFPSIFIDPEFKIASTARNAPIKIASPFVFKLDSPPDAPCGNALGEVILSNRGPSSARLDTALYR